MPLLVRESNEWWFHGGKHKGEMVREVIEDDPSYLAWVWREVMPTLSDEAIDFLEQLMETHELDPYSK